MCSLKGASNYTSTDLNDPVKLRMNSKDVVPCPQTIPNFFYEACHKYKEKPALAFMTDENPEEWHYITYGEYEDNVKHCAQILLHLGVQARSAVAILALNCPEWFYVELAAITIGAVAVGIYPSSSPEAVFHVLHTSEACVCVVDTIQQFAKVKQVKHRLPKLKHIIQLKPPFEEDCSETPNIWKWSTLYSLTLEGCLQEKLRKRKESIFANECALLIFTSGTVDLPKCVMISHDNIMHGCTTLAKTLIQLKPGEESTISYLPLSHLAANFADIFLSIKMGACVYFADAKALTGTLVDTMKKVKLTFLGSVPRMYEKIQEKLETLQSGYNPHEIKMLLGLEKCKYLIVGTAPSNEKLKNYFLKLDLGLYEIFGLSESCGAITFNDNHNNFHTVGKALPGVELMIDQPNEQGEGEICCRGRTVCMGYLKDPIKTSQIIDREGWLHTGDWGFLDDDGNLILNGRIKDLIITSGGENIPPSRIEASIKKELPCVSNALVIGDSRKYLTVLLTFKTQMDATTGLPLDTLESETINWFKSFKLNYKKLSEIFAENNQENIETILETLKQGLHRANEQALSNAQRVQYFTVLPQDFSIATGELGPTLKVKRNVVLKKYHKLIEHMYEKGFTNQLAKDII